MSHYPITWITDNLAVGHAPMSYAEFDSIKEQGISVIVNLCEEFSDLHELEENAGFEVFYLPVADETAPPMTDMEKALEWLDEALYLGKKVLIHCKYGVGRTGTFVTAYMLRRGFNLKKASKLLKKTRANPSNYSQWWLLRKFGKKEGKLKWGEATARNRTFQDLSEFFAQYEVLLDKIDGLVRDSGMKPAQDSVSGLCDKKFSLSPIEALYLHDNININLTAEDRKRVIDKCALNENRNCPLHTKTGCSLHSRRPVPCRLVNAILTKEQQKDIDNEILQLSDKIFQAIFQSSANRPWPLVKHTDAISGKFIQKYFQFLTAERPGNE